MPLCFRCAGFFHFLYKQAGGTGMRLSLYPYKTKFRTGSVFYRPEAQSAALSCIYQFVVRKGIAYVFFDHYRRIVCQIVCRNNIYLV